jgi:hypothetical protein
VPSHGFAGTINEFDSNSGHSKGYLLEWGWSGRGRNGGGGVIIDQSGKHGLVYGGGGVDSPVASASGGVVGFSQGGGFYAEGFLLGHGGGFGVYLNAGTNAGCPQKHR